MIPIVCDLAVGTNQQRRERLRAAVAKMAAALEDGTVTRSRVELEVVVLLCQEYFLPVEAARVRRWMTP